MRFNAVEAWKRLRRFKIIHSKQLFTQSFAAACLTFYLIGGGVPAHSADLIAARPTAEAFTPPADAQWYAPLTSKLDPDWRVGGYVGKLSEVSLVKVMLEPWTNKFRQEYLMDAHAIRTLYRFSNLPLDVELEAGVAQRFGNSHQSEVDLIPMLRWKWWPWNDYLYTNFRLGMVGASYVDGVSAWELQNGSTTHGSHYLNFLVPEFTFAPGKESSYEVFIRVHHRSGAWGTINGVYGGSNYVSIGARLSID